MSLFVEPPNKSSDVYALVTMRALGNKMAYLSARVMIRNEIVFDLK